MSIWGKSAVRAPAFWSGGPVVRAGRCGGGHFIFDRESDPGIVSHRGDRPGRKMAKAMHGQ